MNNLAPRPDAYFGRYNRRVALRRARPSVRKTNGEVRGPTGSTAFANARRQYRQDRIIAKPSRRPLIRQNYAQSLARPSLQAFANQPRLAMTSTQRRHIRPMHSGRNSNKTGSTLDYRHEKPNIGRKKK